MAANSDTTHISKAENRQAYINPNNHKGMHFFKPSAHVKMLSMSEHFYGSNPCMIFPLIAGFMKIPRRIIQSAFLQPMKNNNSRNNLRFTLLITVIYQNNAILAFVE